jgi:hypothetical protein
MTNFTVLKGGDRAGRVRLTRYPRRGEWTPLAAGPGRLPPSPLNLQALTPAGAAGEDGFWKSKGRFIAIAAGILAVAVLVLAAYLAYLSRLGRESEMRFLGLGRGSL